MGYYYKVILGSMCISIEFVFMILQVEMEALIFPTSLSYSVYTMDWW